jgi:hypothetical protein
MNQIFKNETIKTVVFLAGLASAHFAVYMTWFTRKHWEYVDGIAVASYYSVLGFHYIIWLAVVQLFTLRIQQRDKQFRTASVEGYDQPTGSKYVKTVSWFSSKLNNPTATSLIAFGILMVTSSSFSYTIIVFGVLVILQVWEYLRTRAAGTFEFGTPAFRLSMLLFVIILAIGRADYIKGQRDFLEYNTSAGKFFGRAIMWSGTGQLIYTSDHSIVFITHGSLVNVSEANETN